MASAHSGNLTSRAPWQTVAGRKIGVAVCSPDIHAITEFYQPVAQVDKDRCDTFSANPFFAGGEHIFAPSRLAPERTENSVRAVFRSVEPTRTCTRFAANLSKAVLCALLFCCSGCFHHKIPLKDGFRLRENSGAPMLAPTDGQSSNLGNFQVSKLILSGGSAGAKRQAGQQCAINGEIFSLWPASPGDSRHWIVRSPSTSGWNTLAGEIDINSNGRTSIAALRA